ncbi:nucleotidyltransferase, partial [Candidatus Bathyarchaeota archaeon]|nr:nucleotidyltransferase [Candidatus Bathyarchaeota archaeon]
RLRSWLTSNDFEVTVGSPQNPLIVVLDRKEKVEMELWLKPDGVVFDAELLRRRRKARLDAKVEAWVISPEDFIVNKLARPDRGVIDEQDVKSVLVRQEGKLDEEYLKRRAREAGVLTLLENIDAC